MESNDRPRPEGRVKALGGCQAETARFCYARARAYWSLNCTVGATLNEHAADTATPRGRLQPELWPKKCEIHWSAQKWHLARGPNGCEP